MITTPDINNEKQHTLCALRIAIEEAGINGRPIIIDVYPERSQR